jgi:transcriptional regulator with XRE-family HTH domain
MKGKVNQKSRAHKKLELDSEDVVVKLGKRIKQLRKEKGYSYEEFAYENEIPRAQYGRIENGQNITIVTLVRVLNGLGISLKDFFSEGFE